ncbi:unnamed protein product [Adineta ricciae]|uniref:Calponin-homology (CH) domain-containing protein n=1 Tax=Adineta ricciae TaxID=249248 RepID=A0A814UYK4_ADIRI|nr:unnamed protein product [Adineta ricciae]CAF1136310.1 unnamed protein product [Adineta ricciae]CAF1180982.1 unnamed protein product [Adineta ricciae]
MANYGPAYGTLASNLAKMAIKRDPELEKEAQAWIEEVIGEKFPKGTYEDALTDGIILCKLMNKLEPNCIPKYATKGTGFILRENISLFQNAARAYGLLDVDLFQTVDLYEKRNIAQVTHCIFQLARQAEVKQFHGPILHRKTPEPRPLEISERQLFARKSLTGLLDDGLNMFANAARNNS